MILHRCTDSSPGVNRANYEALFSSARGRRDRYLCTSFVGMAFRQQDKILLIDRNSSFL
jgi:hypothetical protein